MSGGRPLPAIAIAGLLVAACAAPRAVAPAAPRAAPATDWRTIATASDLDRLRQWRSSLVVGIARGRAAGHDREIERKGVLLAPDVALADPLPPPGRYDCSVTKLGARTAGMLEYVDYPSYACVVERQGDGLTLRKLTGSQRPVGRLFADDPNRAVFLGTMLLGDEGRPLPYGADMNRDIAGVVQRIAPQRWRIIVPSPRFESLVDVFDLVPAG